MILVSECSVFENGWYSTAAKLLLDCFMTEMVRRACKAVDVMGYCLHCHGQMCYSLFCSFISTVLGISHVKL